MDYSGGDINTGTWASRLEVGHKFDGLVLYKNIVEKSKEVKTGQSNSRRNGHIWKKRIKKGCFANDDTINYKALLKIFNGNSSRFHSFTEEQGHRIRTLREFR
jgi:hypothetical protein